MRCAAKRTTVHLCVKHRCARLRRRHFAQRTSQWEIGFHRGPGQFNWPSAVPCPKMTADVQGRPPNALAVLGGLARAPSGTHRHKAAKRGTTRHEPPPAQMAAVDQGRAPSHLGGLPVNAAADYSRPQNVRTCHRSPAKRAYGDLPVAAFARMRVTPSRILAKAVTANPRCRLPAFWRMRLRPIRT
jgi:hypothetical protein